MRPPTDSAARALAGLVLLSWLGVCGLALSKMPRGFAIDSPRFVLHQALPWLLVLVCAAARSHRAMNQVHP